MSRAPLRVAVLGAGTVGMAVIRAFAAFPERLAPADGVPLQLVGVAVRDLPAAQARGVPPELLTDAPAHLVASPEVDAIVELLGGDEPARTLIAAALGAGKPVVSANKHVVAHHGPELETLARRSGAAFRFEAAVAGGTPVLGPLVAGLAADRVTAIRGIVNGTTNHILTGMASAGRGYAQVLADAQAAGYAEADPRGDVEGDDAVNKLAILTRLAFGTRAATAVGLTIKLLAGSRRAGDSIVAGVIPTAVLIDSPLGRTAGVENRVEIDAEPLGRVAFVGPGAGGPATSSAVLGDLMALARPQADSTWGGLPAAPGPIAARSDAEPRRRFFASSLPEQLVRDQVEIEVAKGGGFIAAAVPLEELRVGLAAAGVAATLYPIDA